ncbi:MAG: TlpA disulfide reductase family protein [Cytophagales bacterium]|nr:TlpA disulfide reductase family protein [Cytophagales bacterium]
MSNKSRTKEVIPRIISFMKPFLIAVLVVAFLQFTGLISAVSFATQWALLQTGLRDASTEVNAAPATFDYQFTIKDLEGNKIPFDQFKDKVLFINLWATWCGPCRAEMPSIQKLYDRVDKDKVTFIMLSIDEDRNQNKVSDYLSRRGFTFKAYMPSGYLPRQLQVPSIPTTFIVAKDGKIVRKEVGTMRYDTSKFQKFLEDLSE